MGVKLTAKQPAPIVTKHSTARWKYRAMFIKPPKVARLTARWSEIPALFAVPRHDLHNKSRQHECACGLRRFGKNHHRKIAHSYLQDVADHVGAITSVKEAVCELPHPGLPHKKIKILAKTETK
jgi:hypothetical protein